MPFSDVQYPISALQSLTAARAKGSHQKANNSSYQYLQYIYTYSKLVVSVYFGSAD